MQKHLWMGWSIDMLTFVFLVVANTEGWKTDEEFGRQRLAGSNPHVIKRIKVNSLCHTPKPYGVTKGSY